VRPTTGKSAKQLLPAAQTKDEKDEAALKTMRHSNEARCAQTDIQAFGRAVGHDADRWRGPSSKLPRATGRSGAGSTTPSAWNRGVPSDQTVKRPPRKITRRAGLGDAARGQHSATPGADSWPLLSRFGIWTRTAFAPRARHAGTRRSDAHRDNERKRRGAC